MSTLDLLSYFMTLVAITLAPGPVFLMLMVRAASNDARGALGFGLGFALGGLIIISVVCLGLSEWLSAVPEIFEYSKYAMLAYILWLAYGIWKGGFDMNGACDVGQRGHHASICVGLVTCFISPYMMILFPLVLPGMMDIDTVQMPEFLVIALTTFVALAAGAGLIVGFAAQLCRLVRSPRNVTRLNRSLSSMLVVGGGWMALG